MTIYKWPITMTMSIAHRVTGSALYFGTALLAWWLIAIASGPNAYANFQIAAGSWLGRLILFGYTWALLHHMLGGIRHLIWDMIVGLDRESREWMAWATLIGSVTLTVLLWIVTYFFTGGLR
jgi:succinate dehydrogenase / fumarate reductase cytochrome b subunit